MKKVRPIAAATPFGEIHLTREQYIQLAERAEDGDLLRRSLDGWKALTGEDLREELTMLSTVWAEGKEALLATARRPTAVRQARSPADR